MPPAAGWTHHLPDSWRIASAEEPIAALQGRQSVAQGVGLAHDAGNLLGAIRLYCDLLALPGVLRAEHRHYAEELRQLSARGGALLDQLLRSDAVPEPEHSAIFVRRPETVRLSEVVTACRGLLDTMVGQGCLLLTVDAAAAAARVAVPRETVERILVNLTKNAAEASEGHGAGAITVRVRLLGDASPGVALRVEDSGRGMSETALRSVLAGERRTGLAAPSESATRPGRGIGLQVVRELVADTGGDLRMESRPGRGTTVEIRWPALADPAGTG